MKKDLTTACGYIRVSSDEQIEGFSLDAQLERIQTYAKSQDYNLGKIYKDDGYSAKDLNRPGIKQLLKDIEDSSYKIVLVYKLDRLTRRLSDLIKILQHLNKYRVRFESVTEPFETKTAPGKLILTILGGFAQFEREVNSERKD